ncbi:DUF5330 domain-containing protein [Oricola thermophila]|uniref:DUF5330 domain-containing protein n=1 Tax=Oricola thermophila TaxID=2742145 RepID=A0A6N1VI54_9HYPH|nr:DUF5330 domain-containing protein [Oricola thermophila]QKV18667.1 DUF5330 domain-containing protein [Oricola thermophila]
MRLVFKLMVLGCVALMVLPSLVPGQYRDSDADHQSDSGLPRISEIATAAGQTLSDIREICIRRPDICETGSTLFSLAGARMREGLVTAYALFRHGHPSMKDEPEGERETASE